MEDAKFRPHAQGLLIGYGLEFVAGMALNLFVNLPKTHPGSSGNDYFARSSHSFIWALSGAGGWQLAFHAYLAIGLVLGSISLFIKCLKSEYKAWKISSGLAALFTLGALFNGLSFIDYSKNVSSMIMALCWLVAVGSLVFALVYHRTPERKTKKTNPIRGV